jgi:hypothetical protein
LIQFEFLQAQDTDRQADDAEARRAIMMTQLLFTARASPFIRR